MKKPLLQEAFDQTIHFLCAAIVVFITHPASIGQAAIVGFALGFVREVTEGGNVLSAGSVRDMIFWTLGGLVMGVTLAAG